MPIDLISNTVVSVVVPVVPDALVTPTGLTQVAVLPVAGVPGPPGPEAPANGSISAPMRDDAGVLVVVVTSNWGITDTGAVYYDPDGAVEGEAAIASLDPAGALMVTRLGS